jgi:hypothetical protein
LSSRNGKKAHRLHSLAIATACLYVLAGDLNNDCRADFLDFALFGTQWANTGCSAPMRWCAGADFDGNRSVGILDLANFAEHWLESR